jgi:hypothetical protein
LPTVRLTLENLFAWKTHIIVGIVIWKMSDIMGELIKEVKTKAYRDDIFRTIQLISVPASL